MGLEDLTGASKFIDDLINTNPVGASDPKSQGDDHIRGIKNVLLNTFPNLTGAVTATQAELNTLDGVTATAAEVNYLDLTTGPGTQEASKAVVADANVNTGVSKVTQFHVGVSGFEVQMTSSKVANAPVIRDGAGAAALDVTGDLLGSPSAPTPAASDNSTRVATTAFVQGELEAVYEDYSVGDKTIHLNAGEAGTILTSYQKIKETAVVRDGALRIRFDLKSLSGSTAYGKLYINGVAVGTERSTSSTTYVTYEEDIAGISAGDLVQVYGKTTSDTVRIQNLELRNSFYTAETGIS